MPCAYLFLYSIILISKKHIARIIEIRRYKEAFLFDSLFLTKLTAIATKKLELIKIIVFINPKFLFKSSCEALNNSSSNILEIAKPIKKAPKVINSIYIIIHIPKSPEG